MSTLESSLTLLGLLGPEPSYGYDLKHDYDRWFGSERPLAFGQVYATLARLMKHGFITLIGDEEGDGPDRKRYEITADGRQRIEDWIRSPDTPAPNLQANLFAKTVIAILLNLDAAALLDAQRTEHLRRMRELTAQKRTDPLATVLMCDYGLLHIDADLRWIELTRARLSELTEQVRGA